MDGKEEVKNHRRRKRGGRGRQGKKGTSSTENGTASTTQTTPSTENGSATTEKRTSRAKIGDASSEKDAKGSNTRRLSTTEKGAVSANSDVAGTEKDAKGTDTRKLSKIGKVEDQASQCRSPPKAIEKHNNAIENLTNKAPASISPLLPLPTSGRFQPQRTNIRNTRTVGEPLKQENETTQSHKFSVKSDEFLSEIVGILVNNGGSLPVKSLQRSHRSLYDKLIRLSDDGTVRGMLQNYCHVFRGSPDEGTVSVLTFSPDLEICKAHGNTAGSCDGDCASLHYCKFKMMTKCKRNDSCFFGHNLKNEYNQSVLKYYFMNKLSNAQIRTFLCRLSNRKGLMLPGICTYYNVSKCCREPNRCPFLHICKSYILGDCKLSQNTCRLCHDISEKQPRHILSTYGLGDATFEAFQKVMIEKIKDTECSSVSEYSSSDEEYFRGNQLSGNARSRTDSHYTYDQICQKWGRPSLRDDDNSLFCDLESDALSDDQVKETDGLSGDDSDVDDESLGNVKSRLVPLVAWSSDQNEVKNQNKDVDTKQEELIARTTYSNTNMSEMTRPLPRSDHLWWASTSTDRKKIELGANVQQELEFLYATYLRARECTICHNGQTMKINFEEMSGSLQDSKEGKQQITMQRIIISDNLTPL